MPRARWAALYPPAEDNTIPLTAHVVLVVVNGTYGLLESGFGHHLSDRQRRAYTLERETQLDRSLAELGISHASIDWIVLSHLHLDHAGGVLGDDNAPAFPHARIYVQRLEAAEARDETNRAHGMYTGSAFDRLIELGVVSQLEGEAEVASGVTVHLTGGHSRGHQATVVSGSGTALLHLGDLLVSHAHLPPQWVSGLDDFPLDSIRAKREWLPKAAQHGWWVALSHDVSAVAAALTPESRVQTLWRG